MVKKERLMIGYPFTFEGCCQRVAVTFDRVLPFDCFWSLGVTHLQNGRHDVNQMRHTSDESSTVFDSFRPVGDHRRSKATLVVKRL